MSIKPTDKELEILNVLWEHGPSTVRFVNESLTSDKEIGYTTTLKFMQIMCEKGLLSRKKEGKTHIYTVNISREMAQQDAIDKVMHSVFNGSAKQLILQVLGNKSTDQKELEEIKNYIDKLKK